MQRVDALGYRLDEQQLLGIRFDAPLPAIGRLDARDDVDAGGEALLDQVARQRGDVERRTDGRQDDDRRQCRRTSSICRAASWATARMPERYCAHSTNGTAMTV